MYDSKYVSRKTRWNSNKSSWDMKASIVFAVAAEPFSHAYLLAAIGKLQSQN